MKKSKRAYQKKQVNIPAASYQKFILGLVPESEFLKQVLEYAELREWLAYHTYDSRRSQAGFPDLTLIRRDRIVFAELKTARGRLTVDQQRWFTALDATSVEAYIWRPSMWTR